MTFKQSHTNESPTDLNLASQTFEAFIREGLDDIVRVRLFICLCIIARYALAERLPPIHI